MYADCVLRCSMMLDQAQASKTRDVVAQQKVVVLLEERLKVANAPIAATKDKRDKVQSFLKVSYSFRACALPHMMEAYLCPAHVSDARRILG